MNNMLRAAYERAQSKFPNHIVQTQTLRVETALKTGTTSYRLNLKQGTTTTDGPLENRLSDQDAFVLLALSIGFKKQDTSVTPNRLANFLLFTYPDPQVFVGAPAGAPKEYEALSGFFNAKLSLKTNSSVVRIKDLDTSMFLYVPQTQVYKQAAPAINDSLPQVGGAGFDSRGFTELQPTILLDGQVNNDVEITLGDGNYTAIDGSWVAAGTQTATSRNMLVVRALGLLIHNGSAAAKQYMSSWQ